MYKNKPEGLYKYGYTEDMSIAGVIQRTFGTNVSIDIIGIATGQTNLIGFRYQGVKFIGDLDEWGNKRNCQYSFTDISSNFFIFCIIPPRQISNKSN